MQTDDTKDAEQPAFQWFRKDHQLARIGVFAACFLTLGVFYLAAVLLPVSRAFPTQPLQRLASSLSLETPEAGPLTAAPAGVAASSSARPATSPTPSQSAAPAPVVPVATPAAPPPSPTAHAPAPTETPKPPAIPTPSASYLVKPGDTMFSIARRHGVSVQQLMNANHLSDPTLVKAGELLHIPG